MRIDKKLNLVIPVEYDDRTLYVHSAPISSEAFEANYMILAKTFSKIYTAGLNWQIGPRIAALALKEVAEEDGNWDAVQASLVNDIERLTNVAVPGANGWEVIPYVEARSKGIIDADDAREVENAITFFIVDYAIHGRRDGEKVIKEAARLWGGQTTSSNCTEFAASLPTSTGAASSGEKAAS